MTTSPQSKLKETTEYAWGRVTMLKRCPDQPCTPSRQMVRIPTQDDDGGFFFKHSYTCTRCECVIPLESE